MFGFLGHLCSNDCGFMTPDSKNLHFHQLTHKVIWLCDKCNKKHIAHELGELAKTRSMYDEDYFLSNDYFLLNKERFLAISGANMRSISAYITWLANIERKVGDQWRDEDKQSFQNEINTLNSNEFRFSLHILGLLSANH